MIIRKENFDVDPVTRLRSRKSYLVLENEGLLPLRWDIDITGCAGSEKWFMALGSTFFCHKLDFNLQMSVYILIIIRKVRPVFQLTKRLLMFDRGLYDYEFVLSHSSFPWIVVECRLIMHLYLTFRAWRHCLLLARAMIVASSYADDLLASLGTRDE